MGKNPKPLRKKAKKYARLRKTKKEKRLAVFEEVYATLGKDYLIRFYNDGTLEVYRRTSFGTYDTDFPIKNIVEHIKLDLDEGRE